MPVSSKRSTFEGLLETHEESLRRFARELAHGEGVDDLAQDVWVTCLQRPPRKAGARSWLRAVALNRFRDGWRADQRRRRREALLAAGTRADCPSPEELALRAQWRRLLADALATLKEQHREVIVLRYVEDRPSAEIARHLGLPAGTVRRRLKEGMDRLRRALDAEPESRPPTHFTLVSPAGEPRDRPAGNACSPTGSPVPRPLPVIPAFFRTLLVAGGSAALGGLLWSLLRLSLAASTPAPRAATALGQGLAARARVPTFAGAAGFAPGETGAEIGALPGSATASAPVTVQGQISDASGGNLSGAVVKVRGTSASGARITVTAVRGDDAGLYRLLLPPAEYKIEARAPGYARMYEDVDLSLVAPPGVLRVDFGLRPAAQLAGTVVDGGGTPVGEAKVELRYRDGVSAMQTLSSPQGDFVFKDIEPDVYELVARKGELAGAHQGLLPLGTAARTTGLLLTVRPDLSASEATHKRPSELRAGGSQAPVGADHPTPVTPATSFINGTVFWDDGRPAAAAVVVAFDRDQTRGLVRASGDGRFRLGPLPAGDLRLRALWPSTAPERSLRKVIKELAGESEAAPLPARPGESAGLHLAGDDELECPLVVPGGRWSVSGRIVTASRTALAGALISARPEASLAWRSRLAAREVAFGTVAAGDGSFVLAGLPAGSLIVEIAVPGKPVHRYRTVAGASNLTIVTPAP